MVSPAALSGTAGLTYEYLVLSSDAIGRWSKGIGEWRLMTVQSPVRMKRQGVASNVAWLS